MTTPASSDYSSQKSFSQSSRVRAGPGRPNKAVDAFLRRTLEITVAALGLLFLFPFFVFIALLIRRDSPGPIYFWGRRVGQGGKEFNILKFRTMYANQESFQGPRITAQGDRRITPIGQWLRDTKLNELPQLWNVLKGEMGLVGPRPEDPAYVQHWPPDLREELLAVRPGVTSPASIIYRDEESLLKSSSWMDDYLLSILPGKLRLDSIYLRSRTILTDLDVLFWTVIVLIPQIRRQGVPEYKLYWGPFSQFVSRHFNWFIVDTLVALAGIGVAGVLWRTNRPLDIGLGVSFAIAVTLALLFGVMNTFLGLNRVYWSRASAGDVLDLAVSSGLVTGGMVLVNRYALPRPLLPAGMLLVGGGLALGGFVATRYRERILTGLATRWLRLRGGVRTLGERVMVVGAGEMGQLAIWMFLKSELSQAFQLVGLVDDDPRKQGMRLDNLPVLGTSQAIPELVARHDVRVILFAISKIRPEDRRRIMDLCSSTQAQVVVMPDVLDTLTKQLRPVRKPAASAGELPGMAEGELERPENGGIALENGDGRLGTAVPAAQARRWLAEVEALLMQGDVQAAREKLHDLQERLEQRKM